MKSRNETIDISRGIAAVLMILGHSFISYPINISNIFWCYEIEHFIFTFHMELFFVIAGMVYKCDDYKIFVKNKSGRILVPYLFFGIISLLLKAFGGKAINGVEPFSYGIKKMLLYGGNYWFLYVLFLILCIFPLYEIITRKNKYFKYALIFFCIVMRCVVNTMLPLRLDYLFEFIPYFTIGNLVQDRFFRNKYLLSQKKRLFIGLGCIISYLTTNIIMRMFTISYPINYIRAFSVIIPVFIISIDITKSEIFPDRIRKLLIDCSLYSLQLYLFNGFILTGLRIVLCNFLGVENALIIVSVILLGNIFIILMLCKLITNKIPFLKVLCGLR